MSAFKCLMDEKLIDPVAVAVGYRHGWMSREDVADYFHAMVCDDGFDGCELFVSLSVASVWSDADFNGLISRIPVGDEVPVLEKWRLARLLEIDLCDLPEEGKLVALQDVYAEFDYPEDMRGCSIYAATDERPLDVMRSVISKLSWGALAGVVRDAHAPG